MQDLWNDRWNLVSLGERGESSEELYLDLLKRCLTRALVGDTYGVISPCTGSVQHVAYMQIRRILGRFGLALARLPRTENDAIGPNMWGHGETGMGLARLNNIQECALTVMRMGVPGDFIETGVWRGGGTIFMRAILKVYGETGRSVWVADSFCGLPKPDSRNYPADAGNEFWKETRFAVSVEDVRQNFARYNLLDDQVRFLCGWFKDTLPGSPIRRLALLRIDGDMYESTMDALRHLYPKLSPGGFVIVDDYGLIPNCKLAVDDYRRDHDIFEELQMVEDHERSCVYWEKR
jgi:O-methyltransferase